MSKVKAVKVKNTPFRKYLTSQIKLLSKNESCLSLDDPIDIGTAINLFNLRQLLKKYDELN